MVDEGVPNHVSRGVFFFVGRMARTKDEDERRLLAVGDTAPQRRKEGKIVTHGEKRTERGTLVVVVAVICVVMIVRHISFRYCVRVRAVAVSRRFVSIGRKSSITSTAWLASEAVLEIDNFT